VLSPASAAHISSLCACDFEAIAFIVPPPGGPTILISI